jgi:hypothetical protein
MVSYVKDMGKTGSNTHNTHQHTQGLCVLLRALKMLVL